MNSNPSEYVPILLFFFFSGGLAFFLLLVSYLRSVSRPYRNKTSSYECGFDPFGKPEKNARKKFNVQFYLVAILFIIFDIEIAFLFPWAVALKKIGVFGFWSMILFLSVLGIGFIYEWKKGALEWE